MKSFTLVFQVLGIALLAPSCAPMPFNMPISNRPVRLTNYKGLQSPKVQDSFLAPDDDYVLTQTATDADKPLRIIAAQPKPNETREEFLARKRLQEEELQRQAKSAKYAFAASLSDRIMDGEHKRTETRDGLKTTGSYTYSDGYVRRTVEYIADENGYRVIKQTEEPIGNGPQPDPTGSADVAAYYDRSKLEYSITADDIRGYYPGDEEEEEEATRVPIVAAFQRSSVLKPAPVPVPVPSPVPVQAPKVVVSNDFNTEQILRPAERHDIQTPIRPHPALRGQYFTQVHSL